MIKKKLYKEDNTRRRGSTKDEGRRGERQREKEAGMEPGDSHAEAVGWKEPNAGAN